MRRARRSPQEIEIEHGLDWWAIALIGYVERVPRHFGDNDGMQPCRFMLTREPWKAHQQDDRASPLHKVITHDFAYVEGRRRAQALVKQLDSLLVGTAPESRLRRSWRDVEDPAVVWHVLLIEALQALPITLYSEADKRAEIARRYERQAQRFRVRRR